MNEMKPLKILLGNNTLALLAGSETWTETLALQLKKMGHTVHCFAPELGVISKRLQNAGIPCFDRFSTLDVKPFSIVLEEKIEHDYDVIIANHNGVVKYLRSQYPKTPIISTIHGIIHTDSNGEIAPEHPALDAGVQQFVSVSEEVKDLLSEKYNIDSVIVRNFLDPEHFNARSKASRKIKQILFNSNYNNKNDEEVKVLKDVAKHYGAKLVAVGENFVTLEDTMLAIKDCDVVVGMGRSVLEGLSAGKLGIVYGRWGFGGVIDAEPAAEELRRFNFSGRNSGGKTVTSEELIALIDKAYTRPTFEWSRNYILRNHNVVHAADFYIQLSRELLGQPKQEADTRRPYRRARDVQTNS